MQGLMMDRALVIPSIIDHAARYHGDTEVVSVNTLGGQHRTNYAQIRARALRMASALQKRGIWEKAQPMAVYGDNVRVSVKRLAMGEVGSAIVYGTDVVAEPRIRILMTFPADSHALISYWGAVTVSQGSAGQGDAARDFADFLAKSAAGALLATAGFLPPPRDTE